MARWLRILLPALAAALALACQQRGPTPGEPTAEFGVFFGGQIQHLQIIPLNLDRTKQNVGFRVSLPTAAARALQVRWELDMPGSTRGVRDLEGRPGLGRLVRLGRLSLPAGEHQLDHALPFEKGDPLGTWNVRILLEGEILLDRPFAVTAAE